MKHLIVALVMLSFSQYTNRAFGQLSSNESQKLSISVSGIRSAYHWRGGVKREGAVNFGHPELNFINPNIQVEYHFNDKISLSTGYWLEGYRFSATYYGNNPVVHYLVSYKEYSLFIAPSYALKLVDSDKIGFNMACSLPILFHFNVWRKYELPVPPENYYEFRSKKLKYYGVRACLDFELDFKKKSKFAPNPRLFLFSPHFLFNKNSEVNVTSTGVGVGLTWFVF